jgi:hypothetical protein
MNQQRDKSDPLYHTRFIQEQLQSLIDHLRDDVKQVDEPRAKALFETTAEALQGLKTAYQHYEEQNEPAWERSPES